MSAPAAAAPTQEVCPLCRAPLGADQDWCLHCGAAARTRLAATPGWRTPLVVLGAIILLALAGLTVALVALTGSSH